MFEIPRSKIFLIIFKALARLQLLAVIQAVSECKPSLADFSTLLNIVDLGQIGNQLLRNAVMK